MNREQQVSLIAEVAGVSKACADRVLDALIDAIIQSVRSKGYVKIHRLCVIQVVDRAPRTARNLRTGATVTISARRAVAIRPLAALRSTVEK